jgi:hypothetical protein
MQKRSVSQLLSLLIVAILLVACGSNRSGEQGAAETVCGVKLETIRLDAAPQMYEAMGTVRSANVSVLNEGDRVAVTQVEKLRDGIRVEAQ